MNTFPEINADPSGASGCSLGASESGGSEYRYSVTSFHPPFASSIPSLNPHLHTQTLTSSTNLTRSELKVIQDEMKDVVLNGYDEDEDPEPDSLMVNSDSMKGNEHDDADTLHAPDCLKCLSAPINSLTDLVDADLNVGDSLSQVWKSEIYNNSNSGTGALDAIFSNAKSNCKIHVLGPSVTDVAAGASGSSVAVSHDQNASCGHSGSTSTASNSPSSSIVLTLNHNEEVVKDEPIRDFSKLNRCDSKELNRNEHLLSWGQRDALSFVKGKPTIWPDRFRDSVQYLRQSQLLLLSTGWTSSDRYCRCCIPNKTNPGGECRLHKFCSYCSWREGHKAQLTYVPVFDSGTWFFLTGSYTGDLTMNTPADAYTWVHYWDAYQFALKSLVKSGDIRGAYVVEELAVNSMLPAKVLPHVHCIIEADAVGEDVRVKLEQLVSQYLVGIVENALKPNVEVASVTSSLSLFHHLRYMFKPINLVKPYDRVWPQVAAHNRHRAQQLNNQLTELVLGYSLVTLRRNKMTGFGNLSAKTRARFIGIKKKDHDQYLAELKRINEQPPEYVDMSQTEEISKIA